VQTLSHETGPLGPGAARVLTFSSTYPQPGTFRSIASAAPDIFNQVNDAAPGGENNNVVNQTITVQPQTQRITLQSTRVFERGDGGIFDDRIQTWPLVFAVLDHAGSCNAVGDPIPGVRCTTQILTGMDDNATSEFDDLYFDISRPTPLLARPARRPPPRRPTTAPSPRADRQSRTPRGEARHVQNACRCGQACADGTPVMRRTGIGA
jgi:hypothetical protein